MTTQIFSAERLVTPSAIIEWPVIVVDENGFVHSIEACEPRERDGTTLAPAFFDIHVHGAAGHDVMEGSPEALAAVGAFLATRGVGQYLATTVTAQLDATLRALEGIAHTIESAEREPGEHSGALPVGVHLEGPFLSHAKRGVHPIDSLLEPSVPLFDQMWNAARGHIRLMTLAPELPGALEVIRHASALGVRISLGHTDATAAQARAGIVAGATSATHTFNAMRRLDHREPGVAGVVLDSDDVYAELICDGVHVASEFIRLWMRSKGEERAILVTDGISATGMPEGEYDLGGLTVAVKDGRCLLSSDLKRGIETLAGSVLTMDSAIENVRRFTGVGLDVALRMATRNPSRMLGLHELGEITVGRPANFNIFGAGGELLQTVLDGRAVPR